MANYIGAKCPVCEKEFSGDDDIVVCPICGTPHHRACYQQIGKCAQEELHSQGHAWEAPHEEPRPETGPAGPEAGQAPKNCPACGASNPPDSIFCLTCGVRLGEQNAPSGYNAASSAYTAAFGGVSPNEEIAGVSARDLALYVGTGSHYFLPRFREIDHGRLFSLNLPAIFNFLYFLYRKMYGIGFALLGLYAVLQIPSVFYAYEQVGYFLQHIDEFFPNMDMSIFANFTPQLFPWTVPAMVFGQCLMFTISAMLMLFGNRIYLHSTVRNIRKIRRLCEQAQGGFDDKLYTEMLARRGRTSFGLVALVVAGMFAVIVLVSIVISIPYGVVQP